MYEVKVLVFCKSGVKREGMTQLLSSDQLNELMKQLSEVGGPDLKNICLPLSDIMVEYIVGSEIEWVDLIFIKVKNETPTT